MVGGMAQYVGMLDPAKLPAVAAVAPRASLHARWGSGQIFADGNIGFA